MSYCCQIPSHGGVPCILCRLGYSSHMLVCLCVRHVSCFCYPHCTSVYLLWTVSSYNGAIYLHAVHPRCDLGFLHCFPGILSSESVCVGVLLVTSGSSQVYISEKLLRERSCALLILRTTQIVRHSPLPRHNVRAQRPGQITAREKGEDFLRFIIQFQGTLCLGN
jgi:hypothetical protein